MSRTVFPKPRISMIELYGANVVASDDEEWKRHRKVSAPAFSEVGTFSFLSARRTLTFVPD